MEYKAGRELDALVAEKVMGYKLAWAYPAPIEHGGRIVDYKSIAGDGTQPNSYRTYPSTIGSCYASEPDSVPEYSTDMAASWTVVEKFKDTLFPMTVEIRNDVWCIWFDPHDYHEYPPDIEANTYPLAICLAALQVVKYTGATAASDTMTT